MDAPLELQDEVLQLDARQFNYRVVHFVPYGKIVLKVHSLSSLAYTFLLYNWRSEKERVF